MREWYNPSPTQTATAGASSDTRTWADVLTHWTAIELDLADRGIDAESGVLLERSWRWLQLRITDIAQTNGTRLHAALTKG